MNTLRHRIHDSEALGADDGDERGGAHLVHASQQDLGDRGGDWHGDGDHGQDEPLDGAGRDDRDTSEPDGEDLHEHDPEPEHRHGNEQRRQVREHLREPPQPRGGGEEGDHAGEEHRNEECCSRERSRTRQGVGDEFGHGRSCCDRIAEIAGEEGTEGGEELQDHRAVCPVGLPQVGDLRRGETELGVLEPNHQRVPGHHLQENERHGEGCEQDDEGLREATGEAPRERPTWPPPGTGVSRYRFSCQGLLP